MLYLWGNIDATSQRNMADRSIRSRSKADSMNACTFVSRAPAKSYEVYCSMRALRKTIFLLKATIIRRYTAAARGAPRHDQRRVGWGIMRALGCVLTDGEHAGAWPRSDRRSTCGCTFNMRALGRVLTDGQFAGAWPRPDRWPTCGRLAAWSRSERQ